MFAREKKKKAANKPIAERTRSILVKQAAEEDIVVHGATPGATAVTAKTAGGEVYAIAQAKRAVRPLLLGGVAVVLIAVGYAGYRLWPSKPEPPPVTRPEPRVEVPVGDYGSFQVNSTPAGARVFLNGKDTGQNTPARLERLSLGEEYEIRLEKDKYREKTRSFALTSTAPIVVDETLAPLPVGTIEISSTPLGATIFVEGKPTGLATPNRIEHLEIPRTYLIRLTHPGHADWSGSVEVRDLEPVKLAAALTAMPASLPPPVPREQAAVKPSKKPEPAKPSAPERKPERVIEEPSRSGTASLRIDSDPSGADVYINAEFKGQTPVSAGNLPSGNIKVLVSKEGFLKYTSNLALKSGESRSLGTIQLEGLYGEVSISSTPPAASIYFDGELIAPKTPVTIRKVPRDRPHSVKLKLDGHRPWETTFEMRDSDSKRYNVTLEKD